MSGSRWAADPPGDQDDSPADPEQVARTILLRRLEAAPRTRAELATTLRERNVPDDVAMRVLDRFEEVGLIDDRVFARMWVESRQRGRGLSGRALRSELHRKGVPAPVIDEALEQVDPEDELAAAREVARPQGPLAWWGFRGPHRYGDCPAPWHARATAPGLTAQVVREALAAVDAQADEDDAEANPAGWD